MSERWLRAGLTVLAVPQLAVSAWALLTPSSWYRDFPGGGHAWVAPLGPYDEHLVRDVGAALLGFGVLLAWAAVAPAPALVRAVLAAWLCFAVPHLIYHLGHTDPLSALDNALSLGSLAFEVLLPAVMIIATWPSFAAAQATRKRELRHGRD